MSETPNSTTTCVRAGLESDEQHGAVIPPLHLSTNFSFDGLGGKRAYDYTRSGNPTRDQLAHALAELEGGHSCQVTASGMSAVHLALQLLDPGDLVIAPSDCYGGTHRLLTHLAKKGHFKLELAELSDVTAADLVQRRRPRLLWIETPSNPLLRISDIAALARAAHSSSGLVLVDNTFLSPVLQRPLELGADLVLHSTTKYLNGHSDVVGGALIAKDPALGESLAWWANATGITGAPFDSFMTLRGLRTLGARMRVHQENAEALLKLLTQHPAVERVHHPSLRSHPGHDVAARQQLGFGPMLSFELAGGQGHIRKLIAGLHCFTLAESLGGVESLLAHPATMTHAAMPAEARRVAGISDQLLRLSVGIEAAEDLQADLKRALDGLG